MTRPGRARLALAVLAGALVVGGAGVASAARLDVDGGSLTSQVAGHPCPGTASAGATGPARGPASGVAIAVPAGCEGRPVAVAVLDGATVLASGTGTVASGTTDVATGAYPPSASLAVVAVVDGWDLPTTWSYTAPPSTAITCAPVDPAVTATCEVVITRWDFWGSGYRLNFDVTSPSTTAFAFEVRLDLAATGFEVPGGGTLFPGWPVPAGGWYPSWTPTRFDYTNVCTATTSADLPVITLRGGASWNRTVSAGADAHSMGIQANQSGGATVESAACR